jgi:XRE family transcriptional regulator, fatty acid utilization regulator
MTNPDRTRDSDRTRLILAINLQRLRRQQGLSQKEVSDRASLSASFYGDLEAANRAASLDSLQGLSRAFGVSVSELLSDNYMAEIGLLMEFFANDVLEKNKTSWRDAIALCTTAPDLQRVMVKTITNIAQGDDFGNRKELLYPLLLRTYQEEHGNYFDEIEISALEFCDELRGEADRVELPINGPRLKEILGKQFDYTVKTEPIGIKQPLQTTRSLWFRKKGKSHLLVNQRFDTIQQTFELAREIGYNRLESLKDKNIWDHRSITSPRYRIHSYGQIWAEFRAAYFAGAVLMPRNELEDDLRVFFKRPKFDIEDVKTMIQKYDVTPEMFLHRLSQILPGRFGLSKLHFLRFRTDLKKEENPKLYKHHLYLLDKYLNMSSLPIHYVESLREKHCRRWSSIRLLMEIKSGTVSEKNKIGDKYYSIQRSHFRGEANGHRDSLCITLALPRTAENGSEGLVSITLGFLMDDHFKATVRFWDDDNIPDVAVGHTCHRCGILECKERAAEPVIQKDVESAEQKDEAVAKLLKEHKVTYDPVTGSVRNGQ